MEDLTTKMEIHQDDLVFENEEFSIITIDPNNVFKLNFNDPYYLQNLTRYMNIETLKTDKFLEEIAKHSNIKNYPNCHNLKTQIIGFDENYVYEMIFMFFDEGSELNEDIKNDLGTLLNIEGVEIYGRCMIFKSYVSNKDYSMKLDYLSKKDLLYLLETRKSPKMIVYDNKNFIEEHIMNVNDFKENLIKEQKMEETDINYLGYNLKVYYLIDESGENVMGKLMDKKVSKMLIHSLYGSMIDNLSKNELNKLIELANLGINKIDSEFLEKKYDDMGREVINTKYRLLNLMYDKYVKK